MTERYILRGDTFIDTVDEKVLIGFGGILDELNRLNNEKEDLMEK